MAIPLTDLLLAIIEEAYQKPAWHGPNLRGTLRRLSAGEAVWRPSPRRHCIAEIVLHCAYWKYAARRRLTGERRGSFPLKGSNWFAISEQLSDREWKEHVRLLDDTHRALCLTVADFPSRRLAEVPAGAKVNNLRLLYGIAMHDVYHAGQIRLIKGMLSERQLVTGKRRNRIA